MRLPAIRGVIERRILANFRVDPDCMAGVLPAPFRPQLVNGFSIGGICLIRLKKVRPKFLPLPWGIRSENAAHRIAVEWDTADGPRQGVYIPRRDTNSRLNAIAGGRIFPGIHHHAVFDVDETENHLSVTMTSTDKRARVHVSGTECDSMAATSVFDSLASASKFFEDGPLGYSDTNHVGRFDGLELECQNWSVQSLAIDRIESSFFEDEARFPKGTVQFDCALLMRDIHHEWHGRKELCC